MKAGAIAGLLGAGVLAIRLLSPQDEIGWDQAAAEMGETRTVCGPLASVRETASATFLNIGFDYPDPDRFTFVVWDTGSLELPVGEIVVVCAEGTISSYEGVAQIELDSTSDVHFREPADDGTQDEYLDDIPDPDIPGPY